MSSLLTAIDIFGAAYTLKTNGKDKYRTKLGGCFTITCLVTIVFFSVVFGLDFYQKTNPETSRNDFEHDKSQYIPLKSYDYMIRIGNSSNYNSLSYPYRPFGGYEYFIKTADGTLKSLCNTGAILSPCSATSAIKNYSVKDFNLSDWFCIDIAKITNNCKKQMNVEFFEPFLGGTIGDESVGYITFGVGNFVQNQERKIIEHISIEELKKMPSTMMDIAYPKAYYDSNNPKDALVTKWQLIDFS